MSTSTKMCLLNPVISLEIEVDVISPELSARQWTALGIHHRTELHGFSCK
jgi:hypothetical protein